MISCGSTSTTSRIGRSGSTSRFSRRRSRPCSPGEGPISAAVIVVAYESGDALTRCLDSLAGEDVIVVNNGSHAAEIEDAAQRTRVIESGNVGFGAGCNRGARETEADVLVFVNPDTVVQPGAVAALAQALEPHDVGVVQARLRLLARPELLNSGGNVVHLSGLAW